MGYNIKIATDYLAELAGCEAKVFTLTLFNKFFLNNAN